MVVEIAARSSPASEPRACRVPLSRVVPMVPTGDPGEEREGVHTAAAIEPAARRGPSDATSLPHRKGTSLPHMPGLCAG